MPTLTIYQKPTCSTCRDAMMQLREAGIDFEAINYIIEPPSRAKLAELAAKMGEGARALIRTKEPAYRELGLDDPGMDDERILDLLAANPVLIQRPILEYGDSAVMARPAARVADALRRWGLAT